jgi:hypothetical protein
MILQQYMLVGRAIVHLLTIWNSTLAVMVQASPLPSYGIRYTRRRLPGFFTRR